MSCAYSRSTIWSTTSSRANLSTKSWMTFRLPKGSYSKLSLSSLDQLGRTLCHTFTTIDFFFFFSSFFFSARSFEARSLVERFEDMGGAETPSTALTSVMGATLTFSMALEAMVTSVGTAELETLIFTLFELSPDAFSFLLRA